MSGIFYEGQEVGCLMYGEGMVCDIIYNRDYPIDVKIGEIVKSYTLTGQYHQKYRPTLYPIEQYRAILATLPAPQPEPVKLKQGQLCWFFDNNLHRYGVAFRRLSKIKDGQYVDEHGTQWECCEPYEPGKLPSWMEEVKP